MRAFWRPLIRERDLDKTFHVPKEEKGKNSWQMANVTRIRSIDRPWRLHAALFAVMLQVFAPIYAVRAAAIMTDPFAGPAICSLAAHSDGQTDDARHRHQAICPLCQMAAGAHASFPIVTLVSVPPPHARMALVNWISHHELPRGPPHPRPHARAPPIYS